MNFMGYDKKKSAQIVDEWERRKWDSEMLAAKETKPIMTRVEAIAFMKDIFSNQIQAERMVDFYIAAGMLEIKKSPEIQRLCSYESNELGLLKIEQWPEGVVVWIAGKIKYKSWEDGNK